MCAYRPGRWRGGQTRARPIGWRPRPTHQTQSERGRARVAVLWGLVLIAVVVAIGGLVGYSIVRRGLSTRVEPSRVEALLARSMRHFATPSATRDQRNPVPPSAEALQAGLEHFADHCAVCHANDGSGDTPIGRSLYPSAPDMRAEGTQSLSDGELFSIIENGIRLTGMPAWGTGTADGATDSWHLVRFIRHLPRITPDEIARMEELNPKSPAAFREEEETRRFLEGDDRRPGPRDPPPGAKPHRH